MRVLGRALPPVLACVLLALALPGATAHGDVRVAQGDEVLTIPPGGMEALEVSVHYHRLFGTLDLEGPGVVSLAVYAEEAYRALAAGEAAAPLWTSGPVSGAYGFNVPVECCDDAAWAPFRLVVANEDAARTARVSLHAKAAHDDLLVGMAGIEGGPFSTLAFFWAPAAFFGYRVGQAALGRGPARGAGAGDGSASPRRLLRRSLAVGLVPLAAAFAAAAWGAARYGGGGAGGFVAAVGTLFPSFGIVAFMGLLALAWGFAAVLWLRAYRLAVGGRGDAAGGVVAVGLVEAAVLAALPLVLVAAYGLRVVPIAPLATLPLALVLGAASVHLAARSRRGPGAGGRGPPA